VLSVPLAWISVRALWRRSHNPEFSLRGTRPAHYFHRRQPGNSPSAPNLWGLRVACGKGTARRAERRNPQRGCWTSPWNGITFCAGAQLGGHGSGRIRPLAKATTGLLLGTSAAGGILTILVARPTGIEYPIVLTRYALFLLPVLLLILAIGLRTLGGLLRGHRHPATLLNWRGVDEFLSAHPSAACSHRIRQIRRISGR
jgi:hypothetical protein